MESTFNAAWCLLSMLHAPLLPCSHCSPLQNRTLLLCAGVIAGLDIGCGASLIYPLLGASLHGWRFVAVDVMDVAISGARDNLALNPHLAPLIEVSVLLSSRCIWALGAPARQHGVLQQPASLRRCGCEPQVRDARGSAAAGSQAEPVLAADIHGSVAFPAGIVQPAMRPGESFAFCMCNPPFFESMEQAGLNPRTAHAGGSLPFPSLAVALADWGLRVLHLARTAVPL